MNPFEPIATFALGWMKQSLVGQWLKYLFELGFSATASFLITFGGVLTKYALQSLVAHTPLNWPAVWALAIGTGAVTAALSMVVLFRKESSRLTKGMLAVLPASEAATELETNLQIIEKSK